MTVQTRPLREDDLSDLLALNNAAVPAVNALDEPALSALIAASHGSLAVVDCEHPEQLAGFVICLLPGREYASENYRWFSARSTSFLYVDRIVIAEGSRGGGLGQVLYASVFATARAAGAAEVFCEVNLEPPNPGSLVFHERLGFAEVGRQSTKSGSVVVALLARDVWAPRSKPALGLQA
ncbi:GNAT family N-acetyltransferase [Subtercola boreus]|uniref:N-acetyltransferase domain-containing protein n=1 Tax=Subtercola boreus TaxID=120213 RepID=A0A3E0WES5_9MICO|nr:GNAT family N-acetyltransferase [Subtercola boreus]RFA22072.1 hypothetical protein B7R24_05130 [Subtercola boreus]RFA22252.1 hypothetical protein B7R23_05075 [Subtercola boreus]RFA28115.1 hypothetical protein B7R25_05200 [Subtercola boreus]